MNRVSRRAGQSPIIDSSTIVRVHAVRAKSVVLLIDLPDRVSVRRAETFFDLPHRVDFRLSKSDLRTSDQSPEGSHD